ncbi:hypothetical protein N8H74_21035 [Pseudomonas sp. B2M1-30]|uniref:Uncharacterized protein n=1 Tax=Pseudomonas koreensis TaxID=198620 RepID=A0A9X3B4I9_9PSED|nr:MULTISPECIES: hypothetical protein [Pseudomonas]MCU0120756.1 hypothetical protein [Pseudomonas sp. B2M1-30]MCU7250546.1 hypothetical protein [Pseudomonas koreensis]MCU7262996.1 hypothetical protein [Pseudomonas koreensis]
MLIALVPSKSAASTLQLVALEGIGPEKKCVRPKGDIKRPYYFEPSALTIQRRFLGLGH